MKLYEFMLRINGAIDKQQMDLSFRFFLPPVEKNVNLDETNRLLQCFKFIGLLDVTSTALSLEFLTHS